MKTTGDHLPNVVDMAAGMAEEEEDGAGDGITIITIGAVVAVITPCIKTTTGAIVVGGCMWGI